MLYLKRSVDIKRDVLWVANDLNEETQRNTALYLGKDVNGAIGALVKAGVSQDKAAEMAKNEIARCKADDANDEIQTVGK
jgi:hypothetical protein